MTKHFTFPTLLCAMLFSLSCADQPKLAAPTPSPQVPNVGGDVDAHGCRPSTGYTWSELKGECIRIFESGIRLDAKAPGLDPTTSAFIVFASDSDRTKAELYIPGNASTQILGLEKSANKSAETWKSVTYKLTQHKGVFTLEDAGGKTLYQGSVAK